MTEPEWLSEQEQAAWRAFLRSYEQLTATLGRELVQETGLSLQDYGVLVALSENPEGRMRAFELGRELTWEKSRVSHHIARMIDRGLVERSTCPTDKRGAYIAITPKGLAAITAAAPNHVSAVRRYFVDLLSDTEMNALTSIAEKVGGAIATSVPPEECCEESPSAGC
jgi:DNA-binding MarR family transcriptional regulator